MGVYVTEEGYKLVVMQQIGDIDWGLYHSVGTKKQFYRAIGI
jgi:hypothetical protein